MQTKEIKSASEIQKTTLKKVGRLIRPSMHYLILSFLFAAISVVLTLYVPILTGEAIDHVVAAG